MCQKRFVFEIFNCSVCLYTGTGALSHSRIETSLCELAIRNLKKLKPVTSFAHLVWARASIRNLVNRNREPVLYTTICVLLG